MGSIPSGTMQQKQRTTEVYIQEAKRCSTFLVTIVNVSRGDSRVGIGPKNDHHNEFFNVRYTYTGKTLQV